MVVAKSGMPIGLDTAARISWLMNTPTSAPIRVTNMAASDRNRTVSRMIAMPTPISSPTGASCWEARSTVSPRSATGQAVALGGAGGLLELLAVLGLQLGGLAVVLDRGQRGAPVLGHAQPAVQLGAAEPVTCGRAAIFFDAPAMVSRSAASMRPSLTE